MIKKLDQSDPLFENHPGINYHADLWDYSHLLPSHLVETKHRLILDQPKGVSSNPEVMTPAVHFVGPDNKIIHNHVWGAEKGSYDNKQESAKHGIDPSVAGAFRQHLGAQVVKSLNDNFANVFKRLAKSDKKLSKDEVEDLVYSKNSDDQRKALKIPDLKKKYLKHLLTYTYGDKNVAMEAADHPNLSKEDIHSILQEHAAGGKYGKYHHGVMDKIRKRLPQEEQGAHQLESEKKPEPKADPKPEPKAQEQAPATPGDFDSNAAKKRPAQEVPSAVNPGAHQTQPEKKEPPREKEKAIVKGQGTAKRGRPKKAAAPAAEAVQPKASSPAKAGAAKASEPATAPPKAADPKPEPKAEPKAEPKVADPTKPATAASSPPAAPAKSPDSNKEAPKPATPATPKAKKQADGEDLPTGPTDTPASKAALKAKQLKYLDQRFASTRPLVSAILDGDEEVRQKAIEHPDFGAAAVQALVHRNVHPNILADIIERKHERLGSLKNLLLKHPNKTIQAMAAGLGQSKMSPETAEKYKVAPQPKTSPNDWQKVAPAVARQEQVPNESWAMHPDPKMREAWHNYAQATGTPARTDRISQWSNWLRSPESENRVIRPESNDPYANKVRPANKSNPRSVGAMNKRIFLPGQKPSNPFPGHEVQREGMSGYASAVKDAAKNTAAALKNTAGAVKSILPKPTQLPSQRIGPMHMEGPTEGGNGAVKNKFGKSEILLKARPRVNTDGDASFVPKAPDKRGVPDGEPVPQQMGLEEIGGIKKISLPGSNLTGSRSPKAVSGSMVGAERQYPKGAGAGGAAKGNARGQGAGGTSLRVSKSVLNSRCDICGEKNFNASQFTGCQCFKAMAKSVTTTQGPLVCTLTFGDEWDPEAIEVLASTFKKY